MEINADVIKIEGLAARALLYPMLPQKLSPQELDALAGGQFGFDVLAGHLYPDMARIIERFGGGRFDAALKLKLQSWLAGWVNPPEHYVLHHPVHASGQWWRVLRTSMFIEVDLEEAKDAARVLTHEELESKYAPILGPSARERFQSHDAWWQTVLATLRMGSWHIALYSPRYQAFISPFILDAEGSGNEAIRDVRAEWPRPSFRFYLSPEHQNLGVFDFSSMIERGSFIELLGEMRSAPPFGEPWGPGVTQTHPGNSQGWTITGVIHAWTDGDGTAHRRLYRATEAPEIDGVALDGPDPFRLVQALFAVTGWVPKGVDSDLMAPDRLDDLVHTAGKLLGGPTGDTPLLVPKTVFLDAVLTHPGLGPVYGRVASLMIQ